ncbi:MAG: thioesterase family protein [Bacteroidota bacterium]
MQIYEKYIIVKESDIDDRNHVNNLIYVQWVLEIAQEHWETKTKVDLRNDYYWILLSHTINYKAEALLGDNLQLRTFVTKSEGLKSIRQVEIYNNKTERLLTTSETTWCLMSSKNNKPTRIIPEIQKLFS